MRPKALVLLSGGLDSAVALWWALDQGYDVATLTFHYAGRPRGETRAARDMVAAARVVEHKEMDLPFLREALDAAPERFAGAPEGYIPFRNAVFYAIASHHAQMTGCFAVVGGHNRDDAALFADANGPFFAGLEGLLARGSWAGQPAPRLHMPLLGLDRAGVLALGARLGVPMRRTWSCYEDGEAPCGGCPACLRRGVPSEAKA